LSCCSLVLRRLRCFFSCYAALRELPSFPTRRSSDLRIEPVVRRFERETRADQGRFVAGPADLEEDLALVLELDLLVVDPPREQQDRKSTRLNSSHVKISYAVFCLKKKNKQTPKSVER